MARPGTDAREADLSKVRWRHGLLLSLGKEFKLTCAFTLIVLSRFLSDLSAEPGFTEDTFFLVFHHIPSDGELSFKIYVKIVKLVAILGGPMLG